MGYSVDIDDDGVASPVTDYLGRKSVPSPIKSTDSSGFIPAGGGPAITLVPGANYYVRVRLTSALTTVSLTTFFTVPLCMHNTCISNACTSVACPGPGACADPLLDCTTVPDTCTLGSAKSECSLDANPSRLIFPPSGATSTLTWACDWVWLPSAGPCSIDQGIGSVDNIGGSVVVSPTSTLVYNLDCIDLGPGPSGGPVRASTTIRVYDFSTGVLREIRPTGTIDIKP